MKKHELLNAFYPLLQIEERFVHDPIFSVRDGRIYYAGMGCLVQIDNGGTKDLPDCNLLLKVVRIIVAWLDVQESQDELSVQISEKNFTLVGSGTIMAVPLVKDVTRYDDIEETVMRPLLTNNYKIEMSREAYDHYFGSLAAPHEGLERAIAPWFFDMLVEQNTVMLSLEYGDVIIRSILPEAPLLLPKKWSNAYVVEPFLLKPRVFKEHKEYQETIYWRPGDIKISFTDNDPQFPSPVMIKYENGVTVVVLPMWK